MRSKVCVTVGRLSVCPINRQQHRRPAGLLLSKLKAEDIDRQLAVGAVLQVTALNRKAGSVTLTADGGGSTQTCLIC